MAVGLGTGSTAEFAIQAIAERIKLEGLQVRGIPTSERSRLLAVKLGVPLIALADIDVLDLTIDGADEVDAGLNLIKGAGGALVQEKIVAASSAKLIIICDSTKIKQTLGEFSLPAAVIPYGWQSTQKHLSKLCAASILRSNPDGTPYLTDDGLYILDLVNDPILDPPKLEQSIKMIPGVAEVGLFCGLASLVIEGFEDGTTVERSPHSE